MSRSIVTGTAAPLCVPTWPIVLTVAYSPIRTPNAPDALVFAVTNVMPAETAGARHVSILADRDPVTRVTAAPGMRVNVPPDAVTETTEEMAAGSDPIVIWATRSLRAVVDGMVTATTSASVPAGVVFLLEVTKLGIYEVSKAVIGAAAESVVIACVP